MDFLGTIQADPDHETVFFSAFFVFWGRPLDIYICTKNFISQQVATALKIFDFF